MNPILSPGFHGYHQPEYKNARDAIRTHEPLQEWILSPSELAGLSYPRTYGSYVALLPDLVSLAAGMSRARAILTL
jgi:hypothetical protein